MKKTIILLALAIGAALLNPNNAAAQTIEPDGTYMFVQRDTCDLFMDVYNPKKGSQTTFQGKQKPTILFMFGGGFIRGTRDNKDYHRIRHETDVRVTAEWSCIGAGGGFCWLGPLLGPYTGGRFNQIVG